MTTLGAVTSVGERFLSERTFELIVAPAIADAQHDGGHPSRGRLQSEAAMLLALLWGLYEDATSDPASVLTFTGLAMIPAVYYAVLMMICMPVMGYSLTLPGGHVAIGAALAALSFGPVIACSWPERPKRPSAEG